MKKRLLSVACFLGAIATQAQVGVGITVPNQSAELAVVSSNRGLLIPNIALVNSTDKVTITAGNIESLLVYNTTVNKELSVGYYYWHNNSWNKLTVEKDIPELVINHFEQITKGGDVTNIIKNIVRNTEGNVLFQENKFYQINKDGDKVEIDFGPIVRAHETLTILGYDLETGVMTYSNEKNQIVTVDIKSAVKSFETITRIAQNLNEGTITFYDEKGLPTVLNIVDLIRKNETETTLIKNSPGNYTYTNEKNVVTPITVVGDITDVISNKLDLLLYQALKTFVDTEETLTKLEYNATTKILSFTDENKEAHQIDIAQIVKDNQDITRIDASKSKNIVVSSVSNGNEVTYTLAVNPATNTTLGVIKPGSGLFVDDLGTLSVDIATIANGKTLDSSDKIIVTNGVGAVLKEVRLDVSEPALSLQNLGGILNLSQLQSGQAGDILLVDASGNVVWSAIQSITTNKLTLEGNKITSNVNNISSFVELKEDNVVSTKGITGTGITVTGGPGSSLKDVGLSITPGSENQVLVTKDEKVEWIDPTTFIPDTTNALALDGNKLTSNVNNVSSFVELKEDNVVSTKGITGTGITVTGGLGASLKDVGLSITPGTNNQVLVTKDEKVEWIDPTTFIPDTTNALALDGNKLISTVNNIPATVDLSAFAPETTNTLTLEGNKIISNVNNVSSFVELKEDNVVSTKGITGTGITVTGGLGASLKDVGLSITPGSENQVLVTKDEKVEWIDPTTFIPDTTNALALDGNKLTSNVNNVSSFVELKEDNVLSTKGITGTGITVTGGLGASLKDVGLSITPGTNNQVLVTKDEKVEWIDPTTFIPDTTNALALDGNKLISTVNNIPATVDLSAFAPETTNTLTLEGNKIISNVNNVSSFVELKEDNVVSTKGITGTGITVTGGPGSSLKDVGLSITPGNENQILITKNNQTQWEDKSILAPDTTNNLTLEGNKITSNVNNVSSFVELKEDNVVSTKGITGTGITVTGGLGASLKDVGLSITPGTNNQVLVTKDEKVEWIDPTTFIPDTTNNLTLDGNKITSNVNNISSFVELKEDNVVSTKGITGTGITVTGGPGSSLKDVGLSITPGSENQVLVTKDEKVEWIDPTTFIPDTTNALALEGNKLISTVNNIPATVDLNAFAPETTNTLTLDGNKITSNVNNISSFVELKEDNVVSTKGITGTGITVTGGPGSSLKDVGLSITPGSENQILVTKNNKVEWENKETFVSEITNNIERNGNQLTSTVNAEPSTTTIIGEVKNTVNGTELVTSVNNVASTSVDLKEAIQVGQKTYSLEDGLNTKVSSSSTGNHTTYKVDVKKEDIQNAQQKTIVSQGTGIKVTPNTVGDTTTYQVAVDAGLTTLAGDVTGAINANKVVALQNVNVSNTTPSDKQVLTYNQAEQQWKAATPQVDVTKVTGSGGVIIAPTVQGNTTTYDVSVKSAMPKFFYMPSILLPTAEGQTTQAGVTFNNATRTGTVDLYAIYQTQFGTPLAASKAGISLPVITKSDLNFFVTYADSSVFINVKLTEQGLLTYGVSPTANVTVGSFMNIVFSIVQP